MPDTSASPRVPRGRHAPPLEVRLRRQRGRLFEAAAIVFARSGYADASAEAISREAGMSKATVADTLCALDVETALPAQPIDPPTITVTFGADGHMGGTAGCNGFGAPYTLDGAKLTIDSIFSTMMFCTEPEGILDQEADFLAALAKTAAYAIEDDRLTLTAADASPVLTAVGAAAEAAPPAEATAVPEAAPPPAATETVAEAPAEEAPVAPAPVTVPTDAALLGQVWQWQETTLADGSVVKVGAPQRYTVQFMDDGIVIGRADCNRAGGIYSVADGALKLKVGVLTRAACPPGSLSTQFVQALNSAATYRFDGDNLVIELRDGAGIMLLIGAK